MIVVHATRKVAKDAMEEWKKYRHSFSKSRLNFKLSRY